MNKKNVKELFELITWKNNLMRADAANCGRMWLKSHRKFILDKSIAPDFKKVIFNAYPEYKEVLDKYPVLEPFLAEAIRNCFSGRYYIYTDDVGVIRHFVYLWDVYLWNIDGLGYINFTIPAGLHCEYVCSSVDTRLFSSVGVPLPSKKWIGRRKTDVFIPIY